MKKIALFFAIFAGLVATSGHVQAQCANGSDCYLVITGNDSYGDGWNGGELGLQQGGVTIGSFTLSSGATYTDTIRLCTADGAVTLTWQSGMYDSEVSFTITDSLGSTLFTALPGTASTWGSTLGTVSPCPTCPSPANIRATALTATSATLSWTEMGDASQWYYSYGTSPVQSGEWIFSADTTVNLTNLLGNTEYYFFVYSYCSASDSSSVSMISFRTACGATVLPLVEGFEPNGTDMPFCWKRWETAVVTDYYGTYYYPRLEESSYYAHTGYGALSIYPGGSNASLISPKMPVLASELEVVLWVSGQNAVKVGYVTTDDTTTAVFHEVGEVGPTAYDNSSYSYTWQQYTVSFDTVTETDSIWIVLRSEMSLADNPTYIDDLVIRQRVNCPQVENLAVVNGVPVSGQVTLTWSDELGSAWQIAYGPQGFDPDAATNYVSATATTATVTDLDDQTVYEFYVRSVCGAVHGYWSNPVLAMPNVYMVTASVDTIVSCGVNVVDNGGLFGDYLPGTEQTIVLMPSVEGMRVRLTGSGDVGYSYGVPAMVRIFAGSDTTGMLMASYSSSNSSYFDLDLTSEVGPMTIWFHGATDSYNVASGYQFYVSCEEGLSCTTPYNLAVTNVQGTSATVSWQYNTALGEADGFSLFVINQTTNESEEIVLDGDDRSYVLEGLDQRTSYLVRLALDCEGVDTIQTTFATGCNVGGSIQIGTGTGTQSYLPTYTYYGNTVSQQLFTSAELEGNTTIYGFRFYQTTSTTMERTVQVYMDTTSLTSYNSTSDFVIHDSSDLYYSGVVRLAQGWVDVQFDRPFIVPADKNIVLTFNDITNSWVTSTYNRVTNTSSAMSIYSYRDGMMFDPTSDDVLDGSYNATTANYRNSIVFLTPCSDVVCAAPANVVAVPDTHSVTLTWNMSSDALSYKVEYRHADSTAWTVAEPATTSTEYTVNNLQPATEYVFRVSSNCSDTSVGRIVTAATLCGPMALPFQEGFEQFTASMYDAATQYCWYRASNYIYGYYYPYVYTYYSHNGSSSMYMYTYDSRLVLPEMGKSVDSLQMTFYAMMSSDYYGPAELEVGVCTNPADTSTYVLVQTISVEGDIDVWNQYEVCFDTYDGPDGYIYIRNHVLDYGSYCYIDDIVVDALPNCRRVRSVTVENITGTSIALQIDDQYNRNNYRVYWSNTDVFDPTLSGMNVTSTTATITGLTPATEYYVWVAASCGSEMSDPYALGAVTTMCAPIAVTESNEYFNELESDVLECMWQTTDAARVLWKPQTVNSTSGSFNGPMPYSGSHMLRLEGRKEAESMLVLPTFDFTGMAGNAELSFYQNIATRYYSSSVYDTVSAPAPEVKVYYRMAESGAWTLLANVDTTIVNTWKHYYFELPMSQGAAVYQLAIKGITHANSYGINIDNIEVGSVTTCLAPTDVAVSSIEDRSAVVTWNGTASTYKVQYRPQGTWLWNARVVEGSDSLILRPLNMASDYEIRVCAVCGAEQSEYSDIVRFATQFCVDREEQNNYSADATAGVSTNTLGDPNHYYNYAEVIVDASVLTGMTTIDGLNFYTADGLAGSNLTGCSIYIGHTTQNALSAFLFDTSFVQVYSGNMAYTSAGAHRITFDTPFEWDGSSNIVVGFYCQSNGYSDNNASYSAHQATANKLYSGFYSSYSGTFTPDMANLLPAGNKSASNMVPDLTLYGCHPVCFDPVVSRIVTTATSVKVEWYNEGAEVQIQIKDAASATWGDLIQVVGTNSYTFENLPSVAPFDIRLRRDCSTADNGYSDWVEVSAVTDTMCSTPENLQVTSVTANSATFSWIDGNLTGGKWELHIWNNDESFYFDVTTNPATVTGISSGFSYHAAVRAYCGSGDHVVGEWSDDMVFDNVCYPVTGLQSYINGNDVVLSWTPGQRNQRWLVTYGYSGFDLNDQLGYMIVNTPTATISGLAGSMTKSAEGTTYGFRVRAICDEGWNSSWCTENTVRVAIDDVQSDDVRVLLQPNPASDYVNVRIEGLGQQATVTLLSVDGRQMQRVDNAEDNVLLDVSSLAAGTYFVRVQTADWTSATKLVVR